MTVTVTAEGVAAMCAVVALVGGVALFIIKAMIDRAMLQMRDWINGSFMRAAVVDARFKALQAHLGIETE